MLKVIIALAKEELVLTVMENCIPAAVNEATYNVSCNYFISLVPQITSYISRTLISAQINYPKLSPLCGMRLKHMGECIYWKRK